MPDHEHYDDDDLFNPTTKHEDRDVPYKPLLWALVALILFGILSHFIVWGLYKAFAARERSIAEGPMTAVPQPPQANVPKGQPLLQPFPTQAGNEVVPPYRNTPVTDMASMREAEAKHLANYGWVDRQRGTVRMPIEIAKQVVVQRGFPAAGASPMNTALPTALPDGQQPAGNRPAVTVPPNTPPPVATPAPGAAGAQ